MELTCLSGVKLCLHDVNFHSKAVSLHILKEKCKCYHQDLMYLSLLLLSRLQCTAYLQGLQNGQDSSQFPPPPTKKHPTGKI